MEMVAAGDEDWLLLSMIVENDENEENDCIW